MIHACELCKFKNECLVRPTSNCADCNIFVREEPQTWGNKIRAMSDEELAEWLADMVGCKRCDRIGLCKGNEECKEAYLQWLKSEVKE